MIDYRKLSIVIHGGQWNVWVYSVPFLSQYERKHVVPVIIPFSI